MIFIKFNKTKRIYDKIKKFKMAYNRFTWSKSNKNKIEYLKNLETQFNSCNDCHIFIKN